MTIPGLLEERATELGDRTFIICEDEEYSYARVHQNACRVAANLARRGVGRDSKIALLMGNCMEFVYVFLGAGRIAATIVPINPTMKPAEIAYVLSNSDAKTLMTVPQFAPFLPMVRQAMPQIKQVFFVGDAAEGAEPFSALLEPVDPIPEIAARPEDLAALIYTSGTTGMPKGVMLTHNNYIWNIRMLIHGAHVIEDQRFLCMMPLFHVNAQVASVLGPLFSKGDMVLAKRFNPYDILPLIEKYKCTVMSAVPTIYNMMCRTPNAESFDLSSIRCFVTGAAPLPEQTYNDVQRILKRPLTSGYGLTEATCGSAVSFFRHPIKWNSTGFVAPYTSMRIVDPDGKDVPYGQVGEILIAGPSVMKGYYKDPEATAAVLKDGWLYTGDLGRFDEEGYLYVVGRAKDMIIRGGQNVYPQEIEDVISQIEGVDSCCVVGVPHEAWGQEILAVIQPMQGKTLAETVVQDSCRERLAPYKCPRLVRFVESFPRTATGKIKKNEVAAQFASAAKP